MDLDEHVALTWKDNVIFFPIIEGPQIIEVDAMIDKIVVTVCRGVVKSCDPDFRTILKLSCRFFRRVRIHISR